MGAAARRRRVEVEEAQPIWRPQDVADRLLAALRWAQRTGRGGARGYAKSRSLFVATDLVFAQEAWGLREIADPADAADPVLRIQESPAVVAGHERALQWVMDHLADQPTSARVLATWLRCKITRRASFGDAVVAMGLARPTAYRYKDRALGTIAQALERSGEPLRP